MTDYTDIIDMLEKADRPYEGIDDEITTRIGYPHKDWTAHLDAAMALVERQLRPQHPCMTIQSKIVYSGDRKPYCFYEITWPAHERQGRSHTPAIALLIALFKALQAQEAEPA